MMKQLGAALLLLSFLYVGPAHAGIDPASVQKLLAGDGNSAAGDQFGYSVSVAGDTALIGAYLDDDQGTNAGSVYVFVRSPNGKWNQQAKLIAPNGAANDAFGYSVSIDDDTAVIGAYGHEGGAAYVFVRSGTTWNFQAMLNANAGDPGSFFGWSVAVDGDTAVVGAIYGNDQDESLFMPGAAYIFVRASDGTWSKQEKLAVGAYGDQFGYSVAVDGDTAVIGSWLSDDQDSGQVYVFVRSGTVWTAQAMLYEDDVDDPPGGYNEDGYGRSVSISGNTVVVGAAGDDDFSGSAYVFVRLGTTWTQQAELSAADGAADDQFGYSVSVAGDTALIGAYSDDSSKGAAYVFTRSANGSTWTQQHKLIAANGTAEDRFGYSVSVDGSTALVGVDSDDDQGTDSGSAYVYGKSETNMVPVLNTLLLKKK